MASMELKHDYPVMEALLVKELPEGDGWQYEPKWDGFRCLAFCEDGNIDLRSKKGQPLSRYFPEVVEALKKLPAEQFVIDGELVIWRDGEPDFDGLLQRIHPADSRIKKLAAQTPATFILFDLLVEPGGKQLVDEPLDVRREALEEFAADVLGKNMAIMVTPVTQDPAAALDWLESKGVKLDGVVAKRLDMSYQSGNRKGMVKLKRMKTADCVVGGFRYGANSSEIGSLLLGLYDEEGELHHVGFTSAFSAKEKKQLTDRLEEFVGDQSFTINVPGGPSRWNAGRGTQWTPLKPELVVEVQYDHVTNRRFRHGTRILRWRPDKDAHKCTFDQLGA